MTDCFFITPEPIKIEIVYVYPLNGHQGFSTKALEFSQSYERNPPGLPHATTVVCNGTAATQPSKDLFNPIPNVSFIDHDNSGWDIGAFQLAARQSTADMIVFFGAHAYFRKPDWLKRMAEVFKQHGNTLYGATGNQGDMRSNVYPHVRTTGFWCSPLLLAQYPTQVTQEGMYGQRYAFEHGPSCFTSWVISQGMQPYIAGWEGCVPIESCDSLPNGFHQGLQENLLVGDRLCQPPYYHTP